MFVCQTCGTMHTEPEATCCGETVSPLKIALQYQERLFESSGDEKSLNVMRALKNDAEQAAQKVVKAQSKLPELIAARDEAEGVLLDFYRLIHQSPEDAA